MNEIPISQSVSGIYRLAEEDKEYIKSFAVDGAIPFAVYVKALTQILNRRKEGSENGYSH